MNALDALIAFASGTLGGAVIYMLLQMRLEIEWWQTRRALRRAYKMIREERWMSIKPKQELETIPRSEPTIEEMRKRLGVTPLGE
jgi:hypothetical protein